MTAIAPPAPLAWSPLLAQIDQGRVVPIIGPDVVIVDGPDGPQPLVAYVAQWTAEYLGLTCANGTSLHAVACQFLERAGTQRIQDLYDAVWQVMEEHPIEVPDALRRLARIRPFNLIVSTSFDGLLTRAIDEARFDGRATTLARVYSPKNVEDLPAPLKMLSVPVVYHLLGKVSPLPETYAVTEEDGLEFAHALQSKDTQPKLLLDELTDRSMLLVGSGYSDWLARFFLRVAKRQRLLYARSATVVADVRLRDDPSLTAFLRTFSSQTRVFAGGAVDFVEELSSRWEEYDERRQCAPGTLSAISTSNAFPADKHPIFLSYANEDREAVQRIHDALCAARLPVWLDTRNLDAGDPYAGDIADRIRACSLFLPVLSRQALAASDPSGRGRWFRREWKAAVDRLPEFFGTDRAFVVPCRVDDVRMDAEGIPREFRELHAPDVSNDVALAQFVTRVRDLFRRYRLDWSDAQ
jgi:hypothetical protein